jgi:hypothetical protein
VIVTGFARRPGSEVYHWIGGALHRITALPMLRSPEAGRSLQSDGGDELGQPGSSGERPFGDRQRPKAI